MIRQWTLEKDGISSYRRDLCDPSSFSWCFFFDLIGGFSFSGC